MKIGNTEISIKRGDITLEEVDAVVNAANAGLRGGGGVDGAIHRAGGPSIMEECRQYNGCPTGRAVITGAGNLRASSVIHAVGPRWRGGFSGESELLHSAYINSLILAKEAALSTIAFPSISTGAYGYPIEEAASVALSAVKSFVEKNPIFTEIRFVLFSDRDLEVYRRAADQLLK